MTTEKTIQRAIIKIGLVDDHRLIRESCKMLIDAAQTTDGSRKYLVSVEAENGIDFKKKLTKANLPEVIFLDINMPEMDGLKTMDWLRENYPAISVIVLTMFSDLNKVIEMLSKGARGYLTKNSDPDTILRAIEVVRLGGLFFDQSTYTRLAQKFWQSRTYSPNITLTDKERNLLKLITTEMSYKEIATQLGISLRTVDAYRDHLFLKLNVHTRLALAKLALETGMIDE